MVIATGFFDGVHLGHREVIGQLVAAARARNEESMVVTFWPHPRTVLRKGARSLRLLSTLAEKKQMLHSLGVDHVEVLPFTREFASLTMEQFLRDYIIGKLGGTAVLLGYDNKLGSDCTDPAQVPDIARRLGLEVLSAPMVPAGVSAGDLTAAATGVFAGDSAGVPSGVSADVPAVSSTKIRAALESGDIASASAMLGYDYSLLGVVVGGNRLGRTIGFPTANIQMYEPLKLVPANGVYFVKVEMNGFSGYGMCNVGVRPTVASGNARNIETYIFDFDEEIYGLDLRLSFLAKVRDEQRFDSLQALSSQLSADRLHCLRLLSSR